MFYLGISILVFILTAVILAIIWAFFQIVADVPYISAPLTVADEVVKIAGITSKTTVIDLGCGTGNILYRIVKKTNARGIGVDISRILIVMGKIINRHPRVEYRVADIRDVDLSEVDVVYCYLLEPFLAKLKPKFEKELKNTVIVSYAFQIPGRKADRVLKPNSQLSKFYMYNF